jgi:hypothetical protein
MTIPRNKLLLWMLAGSVLAAAWYWGVSWAAREGGASRGIPPEKVAAYVHAVIEADRTVYSTQVVDRLQAKGVTSAVEHWEQQNALPLPAQFLQYAGRMAAEKGSGIRYRLISLWPIYQRNAPATDFERQGLKAVANHPDRPYNGMVTSGRKQFFQAIYADRAVTNACVSCHNAHPLSPRRDFKPNDVMGGLVITIPLEN